VSFSLSEQEGSISQTYFARVLNGELRRIKNQKSKIKNQKSKIKNVWTLHRTSAALGKR
jgi:hypothetical protein